MSTLSIAVELISTLQWSDKWDGEASLVYLGEFDGVGYFHRVGDFPIPTSAHGSLDHVTLTREISNGLRGQHPINDAYLLPLVPESVTRRQGLRALLHFNLMTAIDALMDDPETPQELIIDFREAPTFERNGPSLIAIAGKLDLSDELLDQMFIYAGQI